MEVLVGFDFAYPKRAQKLLVDQPQTMLISYLTICGSRRYECFYFCLFLCSFTCLCGCSSTDLSLPNFFIKSKCFLPFFPRIFAESSRSLLIPYRLDPSFPQLHLLPLSPSEFSTTQSSFALPPKVFHNLVPLHFSPETTVPYFPFSSLEIYRGMGKRALNFSALPFNPPHPCPNTAQLSCTNLHNSPRGH